ncbi:MAG: response regulator [Pseudomonadota bacterium]
MDSLDDFVKVQHPTALRPLLGQTVLAVEDSRFACEAIRLVCLKSGARIRRADCLHSAHRHLRVYRPSVVLVDMGLPDGSGIELVKELVAATPRVPVIMAMSGDDSLEEDALAAGADGFLTKPIASLAAFQTAILAHLPADRRPNGPRALMDDDINPDCLAFQDDLDHALEALTAGEGAYAAQFLASLAQCIGDNALADQASTLAHAPESEKETAKMRALITKRAGHREAV